MKYSDRIPMTPPSPRLLRRDYAAGYVAGEQNLLAAIDAGWIKPVIQHSGCTAFDRKDLDACIERAKLEGGWPQKKKKESNACAV
jgi:hypothetical protein